VSPFRALLGVDPFIFDACLGLELRLKDEPHDVAQRLAEVHGQLYKAIRNGDGRPVIDCERASIAPTKVVRTSSVGVKLSCNECYQQYATWTVKSKRTSHHET
jgi:hypothetical protein